MGTESREVCTRIVLCGVARAIVIPSTCTMPGPDVGSSFISTASVELTTTERFVSDCGQIGVIVSTLHSGLMIGPPAAQRISRRTRRRRHDQAVAAIARK